LSLILNVLLTNSCQMWSRWWPRQTVRIQYGSRDRGKDNFGPMSPEGELTEEKLRENREDMPIVTRDAANEFIDDMFYDDRMAREDYGKIEVPLLSAGNWVRKRPIFHGTSSSLMFTAGWSQSSPSRKRKLPCVLQIRPIWKELFDLVLTTRN
jgi:hypothetical protein